MNRSAISLRRRQVDRALSSGGVGHALQRPQKGWIAEVRNLIGMRASQVAARMGVTTAAVLQLERSEVAGSISLKSLERVASAMDCHLVYGFLPNGPTYEGLVQARAHFVALREVRSVGHSMAMEEQATSAEAQEEVVDELAQDLVRTLPRDLWDEPP